MSWNEPGGGNRQRDPWGGKDQGPPDLDEALKKLQDQLNGLFGGRSGGGSSKGAGSLIGIVAVIAVTVWGLMGLTQIGEQEQRWYCVLVNTTVQRSQVFFGTRAVSIRSAASISRRYDRHSFARRC